MPNLVRAQELADILSVDRSTIWRWSAIGKIPKPLKIGSRVSLWDADKIIASLMLSGVI